MAKTKISGDLLGALDEGVVMNEGTASAVTATQGTLFVSDGTGPLTQNNLYYKDGSGTVVSLTAAGVAETLTATLAAGNTSGGTDIQLTTGDELTGQTDVVVRPATNGNLDLVAEGTGSVRVYSGDPADAVTFVQMGENQETGLAHIKPGVFGTNGVLVMGLPDLSIPVPANSGATTVDVKIFSPPVQTNTAGAGVASGQVNLNSGDTSFTAPGTLAGASGQVNVSSGDVTGAASSGEVTTRSGNSSAGTTGPVYVESGTASAASGPVELRSGSSTAAGSGDVSVSSGQANAAGQASGDVRIKSGPGDVSGDVLIEVGTGASTMGTVEIKSPSLKLNSGTDDALVYVGTGNPHGSVTSTIASLFISKTGPALYQSSGGTNWAQIGAGGAGWPTSSGTYSGTAWEQALVASANGHMVLSPNGTGAISSSVPDGAAGGGNIRGASANDLQRVRSAADQVASGASSVIMGGEGNKASGGHSVVSGGESNRAEGVHSSVVGGEGGAAIGDKSVILGGELNQAHGTHSVAMGEGSKADLHGELAHSGGSFAAVGDAQHIRVVLKGTTANATPVDLLSGAKQLELENNSCLKFRVEVAGRKSNGDVAWWDIVGCIKRGANAAATAMVGTMSASHDADAGVAAWTVGIAADTTAGALRIRCTGDVNSSVKWVATAHATKIVG